MASPAIQAEAVVRSVTDTQPEMLTTSPPAVLPPRKVHRLWAIPLAAVAFLAVVALLFASMLPADLHATNIAGVEAPYALVPANADPVAPRLSFDAVPRYDASGEILFVTIRQPEITLLDWFIGRDQPEVGFLSYEDKFGPSTPSQTKTFNFQMMRTAKETAEYQALSFLGYPAELRPGDVIIQALCDEVDQTTGDCITPAPADEVLDPGDQIIAIDGQAVEDIDDLTEILSAHAPGDTVTVRYVREGEGEQEGAIELIESDDGERRTIIGFYPFDTASVELPFEVNIDSGDIGGPSAGLAFTLTVIDEITPGELTGDHQIAVTGTIDQDGNVGAIGGLVSKTSAVKQLGVTAFIVPAAQGEEDIARARAVAGDDLEVVPVATLQEAIEALARFGGNGLELGKPGADYTAG